MKRLFSLSAASQALLLVYLDIVEWMTLYRGTARGSERPRQLDFILGLLGLLAIVATQRRLAPSERGSCDPVLHSAGAPA